MATIFHIKCPKCGYEFEIMKGILMCECDLEEITEDRKEETPFSCSHCKHQMSVLDEDFDDNVEMIVMAD